MVLPKYQSEKGVATPKASPKKRGIIRGAALEPPSKKRGKVAQKASAAATHIAAANAATAKRATILRALQEAHSIPAPVRELLCSTLPGCCSISGLFHPFQQKVLQMLSETLENIRVEKTRKVQKVASITSKLREELQRFEKSHANAEAAVAESFADVKQKEEALAQSAALQQSCKLALQKAQAVLQHGDTTIGAAAMESEQIRSMRARMRDVSEESTLAMLQDFCCGLELSPEKLDNLTLLEGELCQRLAMLTGVISKAAVARVTLVADLKSSQKCLDTANATQQECAAALARSQADSHDRVGISRAKSLTLKQQKSIVAQTLKALHTAQKHLAEFQNGAHTSFKHIVKEIEKRRGTPIFKDLAIAMEADAAPLAPEFEEGSVTESGTPVIDRQQRQAFLRRRSAVLPQSCFGRLSLMARRSSVAARRRSRMETHEIDADSAQTTSFKTCGIGSDGDEIAEDKSISANGTPVIDRQQRQAFLRRRSAVLPASCFGRLSLMSRRSSVAAKRLRIEAHENDSRSTQDEGAEVTNIETQSILKGRGQLDQESRAFDGAMDLPTPSRRSFGSGTH